MNQEPSLTDSFSSSGQEFRLENIEFAASNSPIQIGRVFRVGYALPHLPNEDIAADEVQDNLELLKRACISAKEEMQDMIDGADSLPPEIREEYKSIYFVYQLMVDELMSETSRHGAAIKIINDRMHAETAVAAVFSNARDSQAAKARAGDVKGKQQAEKNIADQKAITDRVIRNILLAKGHDIPSASLRNAPRGCIVIADNLEPSDTLHFVPRGIAGVALMSGTRTGHVAIVSKDLDIACAFTHGRTIPKLHDDMPVILDPVNRRVIINPSGKTLREYDSILTIQKQRLDALDKFTNNKARLRDTQGDDGKIHVFTNIDSAMAAQLVVPSGADGVGLYRSEFFFTVSTTEPAEETQVETYRYIFSHMHGKPVTARLLDTEGDKDEGGWLRHADKIKVMENQIRALLKASALESTPVHIMLPVVRDEEEMIWLRQTVEEKATALKEEGMAPPEPKIGMMVEIPNTADDLQHYVDHADFLSIGSNDLVRWLSGGVRNEEGHQGDPTHPNVLQKFRHIVDVCNAAGKPVSICGKIASIPEFIPLLVGCGLRKFSAGTGDVTSVKEAVTHFSAEEARELVDQMIGERNLERRKALLCDFNQRHEIGLSVFMKHHAQETTTEIPASP